MTMMMMMTCVMILMMMMMEKRVPQQQQQQHQQQQQQLTLAAAIRRCCGPHALKLSLGASAQIGTLTIRRPRPYIALVFGGSVKVVGSDIVGIAAGLVDTKAVLGFELLQTGAFIPHADCVVGIVVDLQKKKKIGVFPKKRI